MGDKCSEKMLALGARINVDIKEYGDKVLLMLYERNRKNIQ